MKSKDFGPGLNCDPASPVYIGIDPSYSGFAVTVYSSDDSYYSVVTKFSGQGGERLKQIYDHVYNLIMDTNMLFKVESIAMEGYAYGSQMANALGELGGVVKLAMFELGYEPVLVAPPSLKKYATGKGNGVQKSVIMLKVFQKWNVQLLDDNAADSFVLARMASRKADLAYEQEVLKKVFDEKD